MDKFTSQAQVEETADFQAWLDAQEVADIRAMEAEALAHTRAVVAANRPRRLSISRSQPVASVDIARKL